MSDFGIHPNQELVKLFRANPWQGQNPEMADILILAHDANYSPDVDMGVIRPYLEDGVWYWETEGIHHPFMHPNYSKDGALFHQSFAKLGLGKEYASRISFVELLHYPTYGSVGKHKGSLDYSSEHFFWLDHMIQRARLTFILGAKAVTVMKGKRRKWNVFKWLPKKAKQVGSLEMYHDSDQFSVYGHYHYSCRAAPRAWNVFNNEQIPAIKQVIQCYCPIRV